jgi:amidase
MADIALQSARTLAEAIRRREISSRELLDHYLARVERLNPPLNAVVTVDVEGARRAADAADKALARGGASGPLHGVPMTIKDTYETAGMRTTCGFEPWSDHHPEGDAEPVRRLREAGAVVFGKTNTPTLAGDWQTHNPIFGVTNNPWSREHTTGGSSGGAAAAVAAGLTALELGSDIGGSIRVPSSWCGVCGHKPTWGVVPQHGHLPPPPGTLAETDLGVMGPIARTVDDLELALDIVAGPHGHDAVGWRLELPPARATALRELRLAAWLTIRLARSTRRWDAVPGVALVRGARIADRRPTSSCRRWCAPTSSCSIRSCSAPWRRRASTRSPRWRRSCRPRTTRRSRAASASRPCAIATGSSPTSAASRSAR